MDSKNPAQPADFHGRDVTADSVLTRSGPRSAEPGGRRHRAAGSPAAGTEQLPAGERAARTRLRRSRSRTATSPRSPPGLLQPCRPAPEQPPDTANRHPQGTGEPREGTASKPRGPAVSPGTGLSGTHFAPGCSTWKAARTERQAASPAGCALRGAPSSAASNSSSAPPLPDILPGHRGAPLHPTGRHPPAGRLSPGPAAAHRSSAPGPGRAPRAPPQPAPPRAHWPPPEPALELIGAHSGTGKLAQRAAPPRRSLAPRRAREAAPPCPARRAPHLPHEQSSAAAPCTRWGVAACTR